MQDVTHQLGRLPPCVCGCGGQSGHILSTERYQMQCTAMTVDEQRMFRRCSKALNHSHLVPHGDGEVTWYS